MQFEYRPRQIFRKLTKCSVNQSFTQIQRHYYQQYDTEQSDVQILNTHYGSLIHPETSYSLEFNLNKGAYNLAMSPDTVIPYQDFFMPKVYGNGFFTTTCNKFDRFTNLDIYGVLVVADSEPTRGQLFRVIQDRSNPSNIITYYAEKLSAIAAFNINNENLVLNNGNPSLVDDMNVEIDVGNFRVADRFLQANGYSYYKVTTLACCIGKIKDVSIQTLAAENRCIDNTYLDHTEPGDEVYAGGQFNQTGNFVPVISATMQKIKIQSNLQLGTAITNGSLSLFNVRNYVGQSQNYQYQPEAISESFKLFADEQASANGFYNYSSYVTDSQRPPIFGAGIADLNQAFGGRYEAEYAFYWMLLHLSRGCNRVTLNGFDYTQSGVIKSLNAEIDCFGDMDFWKI